MPPRETELVIITGLSGSGKGTVLKALEDLGYYSVDNLPTELIPKFAELTTKRLSEVIVEDPDAGYTGPLAIQACKSGSPTNPLKNGTLPEMGGS